jgi:hypothetical protein
MSKEQQPMNIDATAVRKCLKSFDFATLFREHLGWDKHQGQLAIPIDGQTIQLNAIAQKRGFAAYVCSSIPDRATRLKIDNQITKTAREHFVIYADQPGGQQVWQWVRREPGKPLASRDHRYDATQSGDPLIQRLANIAVSFEEEEEFTLSSAVGRVRKAFDVDKVTKKFYELFKAEHTAFQKFIKGIKGEGDLQWYTSIMLNRLMFVYFIQKKGFLDSDTEYLRNRMKQVRENKGKDKFLTFYRYFLLRLFHDGLGKSPEERKLDRELEKLLGKVPYLNGGFFEVHELEARNPDIDIPDKAFEKLFDFFDEFRWHLDERPLRSDNEINPDVVGYIFEKYINQKQMGAYYTKEDITEYISKNTIIPFLFDAAEKKCPIAFKPESFLWKLLRDNPDRYIYAAVRHGVIDDDGKILPLPKEIEAGIKNVAKRDGWNKPAVEPFALPTETWREHVARRQRCLELREKLQQGQVHAINDLITLNLDIWQFARDAIINSEGPELLRAFWQAIQKVTVLDPTCGSGAFLFAALRILESLYSDCLERMERFVEDLAGKTHHPEQFSDFKKVLAQTAKHPSERYFVLKSIIINNLFGVDIMEEAVEICKLRLFLKLVAQVDTAEQIEPLPDIDFNIRAGNTLVGYVSLDQVRESQKGTFGFAADEIDQIEEDSLAVEKCFQQFRAQQTTHGGKVTSKDKQELRRRLQTLDAQLDRYLAGEYGVAVGKRKSKSNDEEALADWKVSHEPFHWFVEFYGIMATGGFDVIIGNPPYVEYAKVKKAYTIRGYRTEGCGNLYAFVWERCLHISAENGRVGMIQPVASVCTDGYEPLQAALRTTGSSVVSNFNDRPSKLFDGLEHIRLCIILHEKGSSRSTFSTTYNKWQSVERETLFHRLSFIDTTLLNMGGAMAKVGSPIETSILAKFKAEPGLIGEYERAGKWHIYYTRKLSHFVQILDFVPSIKDEAGKKREPSELKDLTFATEPQRDAFLAILNSSLFYWLLTVYSDCRNLNRRDIGFARFNFDSPTAGQDVAELQRLCRELMTDVRSNSKIVAMRYKDRGELRIQCTYPKYSKHILDEIDNVLGRHFHMTPDESDFVVNYDIKYRVGADSEDDE